MASSAFPDNIINNPLAQPAKKRTRSSVSDVLKRSQRLYARQLEGKTTRQLDQEQANIEGISEVKNNLTVDKNYRNEDNNDDKSFSRAWHDMTVTAGLKMELAAHDELEATAIEVSTDNGVVTLKGNVKNEAEKDLAVEMAKGYDKVVEVKDELVVTN